MDYEVFPAAEDALRRFGGLRTKDRGHGVDMWRGPIALFPSLVEQDRIADFAADLRQRLVPLGEIFGGHMHLVVAEDGRCYGLMMETVLIGDSIDDAVENLILGKTARAGPDPHPPAGSFDQEAFFESVIARGVTREQAALCARIVAFPEASLPEMKVGVGPDLTATPIHGLRHRPGPTTSGWYIWTGEETSPATQGDAFFRPVHVSHLSELLPMVTPYLALPPGWRFLLAHDYEDVWREPWVGDDVG